MRIDRDEARRIADLAHLAMDDAALDAMASEMTAILDYVDQLREVDLSRVTAGPDSTSGSTPLRGDVPGATIDRRLVEANAPAWSEGFFVVPKVIGE